MVNEVHGKFDQIEIEGTRLNLSGPLFWNGEDGQAAASAITIVAVFVAQSAAETLVASMAVDREFADHAVARWGVALETDSAGWHPQVVAAASVVARWTSADTSTQGSDESWDHLVELR